MGELKLVVKLCFLQFRKYRNDVEICLTIFIYFVTIQSINRRVSHSLGNDELDKVTGWDVCFLTSSFLFSREIGKWICYQEMSGAFI